MRVALISLEPWDDVWRRNQHFAVQLVAQGLASTVLFVEPPLLTRAPATSRAVANGVTAVRPSLRVPKRAGGLALTGMLLRAGPLRSVDVLWVNDAALGVHCLRRDVPAVYDVTDDWREFDFPARILRRLVRAEDRLARRARTVVCSGELQARWQERYGVDAAVVHNGVDQQAWADAVPRRPQGPGPHVGYVGTLHEERLDVGLVLQVADLAEVGQLHLIGPDALGPPARAQLQRHPKVRLHGPVPSSEVPGRTKGLDVLLSPHVVSSFTLSLDAIKSYEYLASGMPIVATPTSGFQLLSSPGLVVTGREQFAAAVVAATSAGGSHHRDGAHDWSRRAGEFSTQLLAAASTVGAT